MIKIEEMTIEDLFKGLSVASANDATVAIAETISGSEEEFISFISIVLFFNKCIQIFSKAICFNRS